MKPRLWCINTMPIATDKSQRDIVLRELAEKVAIETSLAKGMRKVFKKIVADLKVVLEVKKKSINFEADYFDDISSVLGQHYVEAQKKALQFFLRDPIVRSILTDQELLVIRNNTVRETNQYLALRNSQMTKEILGTTKQNLADSYTYVDKLAKDNDLALTEEERDSMVMDNFSSRLDNRADTIATTETQNSYEKTKAVEGTAVADRLARQGMNMQKRWDSTLDSRTRYAHAMAHGQRVPVTGLFTVMGQQLDFPGDTSHGATLENVINCRCTSQYVIIQ